MFRLVAPRRALMVVAAAAVIAFLAACGSSDDVSSTQVSTAGRDGLHPVRLAYIPAFGTLPLHIAVERGLFERHGVEAEVTEGTDIAAWTAALGKQFDIVHATPTGFLAAASAGLPVKVVSGMQTVDPEHVNNVLISRRPVASIADLAGKKVGVLALAGTGYDAVRYLLLRAGQDPKDVRFVATPLPTQADQVRGGQLDAAVSALPFFTGLDEQGLTIGEDVVYEAVAAATNGKLPAATTSFMISSDGFLDENADAARAFRAAVGEAMRFIEEHPDEARSMLQKWLRLPAGSVDDAPMAGMALDEPLEDLQAWLNISTETGTLRKQPPAVDTLIWPEALERAR